MFFCFHPGFSRNNDPIWRLRICFKWVARRWQLNDFSIFTPNLGGRWTQFDYRIFFRGVGEKPTNQVGSQPPVLDSSHELGYVKTWRKRFLPVVPGSPVPGTCATRCSRSCGGKMLGWVNPLRGGIEMGLRCYLQKDFGTLPETNISPENRPLEKEIPIENHHFQRLC